MYVLLASWTKARDVCTNYFQVMYCECILLSVFLRYGYCIRVRFVLELTAVYINFPLFLAMYFGPFGFG